ncbi:hypothetical protein ACFFQW_36240 [Umezawaea endophytica]|uniref:Uncharacterized protein n=1 Tax=Umezawaea endophytica TaxID=1654476 RepID=A0A9X3AFY8_9PSEU|nr:hypothetical protein [Umezawaea endophytica]MCS7478906.1 hypothetical protein [Umezawaea endophytica]
MTIHRWARGSILVTAVLAAVLGAVGTARADPAAGAAALGTWSSSGDAWTHRFPPGPTAVERTVQPVTELGGAAPGPVQPVVAVDATSPWWAPDVDLDLEGYGR